MGISIREYAEQRGVSEAAVRKARDNGRITTEPDGTIDPATVDKQWSENTAKRVTTKATSTETSVSYQKSRANKEFFEFLLKKLEYEEKNGKMVELAKMETEAFTAARVARDRLLSISERVAPQLVGKTDIQEIKEILRREITTSLQNLTDFMHAGTQS